MPWPLFVCLQRNSTENLVVFLQHQYAISARMHCACMHHQEVRCHLHKPLRCIFTAYTSDQSVQSVSQYGAPWLAQMHPHGNPNPRLDGMLGT